MVGMIRLSESAKSTWSVSVGSRSGALGGLGLAPFHAGLVDGLLGLKLAVGALLLLGFRLQQPGLALLPVGHLRGNRQAVHFNL